MSFNLHEHALCFVVADAYVMLNRDGNRPACLFGVA